MKKVFLAISLLQILLFANDIQPTKQPSLSEIAKASKNNPNSSSTPNNLATNRGNNTSTNSDLSIQYDNQPIVINTGKDEAPIDDLLMNNVKPQDVESIRKEEDSLRAASQKPLKEFILSNNVISYKKGMVIDLNVLYQVPMVLELFDVLQAKTEFKYISPNSPYFTVTKDPSDTNRLFITATQRYRSGIITLGIKGLDDPIVIRINENNSKDTYSTFNKVVISDPTVGNTKGSTIGDRYRERLLKQNVKLDNFDTLPSIKYEIWTLKEKKLALIGDDALNIYYVDNDGVDNKGFYILILHKLFDLEGYDKLMFENYKNDYSAYLLNFNTNVFTIYSKETKERYRVILKGM